MLTGELGYTPYEFFNLLPRELNDIIEGYNNKILREIKLQGHAVYVSWLPHIKQGSVTEEDFNLKYWHINEGKEEKGQTKLAEDKERERVKKMQEFVRQHQLKLSEEKRLKQSGK